MASVPIYLPDQTIVAQAQVNVQGSLTTITINSDSSVSKLIQENLVGLAVVYFDRDAVEEVLKEEKN